MVRLVDVPQVRLTDLLRRAWRRAFPEIIVATRDSAISGKIQIVDRGRERYLRMHDGVNSLYIKKGSWTKVQNEYWGQIYKSPFGTVPHPNVMMLGLGGGTILHLLQQDCEPKSIVAFEKDPEIVTIANEYFGLKRIVNLEIIIGDMIEGLKKTKESTTKFDLIIDDASYSIQQFSLGSERDLIESLASLLASSGTIAFNRPIDDDTSQERIEQFVRRIESMDFLVKTKYIIRRWSNCIVFCQMKNNT